MGLWVWKSTIEDLPNGDIGLFHERFIHPKQCQLQLCLCFVQKKVMHLYPVRTGLFRQFPQMHTAFLCASKGHRKDFGETGAGQKNFVQIGSLFGPMDVVRGGDERLKEDGGEIGLFLDVCFGDAFAIVGVK